MQINREDNQKRIEIWLTNEEKSEPVLCESLKPLFKRFHDQKYLVAVFLSGEGDLYEGTRALLLYNRRRAAERDIQAERHGQTTHD